MKEKILPMSIIPPLKNPINGEIYNSEGYKKCCQVEFNKDGSADLYDYNTTEHIKHLENIK